MQHVRGGDHGSHSEPHAHAYAVADTRAYAVSFGEPHAGADARAHARSDAARVCGWHARLSQHVNGWHLLHPA